MTPTAETVRDTAPAGETGDPSAAQMLDKQPGPTGPAPTQGQTGASSFDGALGQSRPDFTRSIGLSPAVEKQIDDAFQYHPWDEVQTLHGSTIRQALANAVKTIVAIVPPCPDRTAAIRKLREARMDCNSAITHNGRY